MAYVCGNCYQSAYKDNPYCLYHCWYEEHIEKPKEEDKMNTGVCFDCLKGGHTTEWCPNTFKCPDICKCKHCSHINTGVAMKTNTAPGETIEVDYSQWLKTKEKYKQIASISMIMCLVSLSSIFTAMHFRDEASRLQKLVDSKTIIKTKIEYKDKIVYKDRVIEKMIPIPNLDQDEVNQAASLYREIKYQDSVYDNSEKVSALYKQLRSFSQKVRAQAYANCKDQLKDIHR